MVALEGKLHVNINEFNGTAGLFGLLSTKTICDAPYLHYLIDKYSKYKQCYSRKVMSGLYYVKLY